MTTIVTRTTKGSALTWAEADANFNNLNNQKVEASNSVMNGTASVEGLKFKTRSVTATTTLLTNDFSILADATSGSITLNLPTAVGNTGLTYEIKKTTAANSVIIDPNGAQTIDGAATITLTAQYDSLIIRSDGTNWVRIAQFVTTAGGGTVTSVAMSGGTTGLTFTGGPVTGAGTFTAGGILIAPNGGTGQSSYTVGDLLYASSTTALSKLAAVASNNVLISNGVGVAPSWGNADIVNSTTGTLTAARGGTGATTATGTAGSVVLSIAPTLTGKLTIGGLVGAFASKSANYTLTTSDLYIQGDTTAGNITLTLPAASGKAGLQYHITKIAAANSLIIDPNAAELINGASTYTLGSLHDSVIIECDGSAWRVVSSNLANPSFTSVTVSSFFLGGNIYVGGGGILGWQSSSKFVNNGDGDMSMQNNAGTLARLRTGGVSGQVVTKTAAYTTTANDTCILCDTTTAFTLTLHTAVGNLGQTIEVVKTVAANTLTIATTSSQTINGAVPGTQNLTAQWSRFTVRSDGANWVRVD